MMPKPRTEEQFPLLLVLVGDQDVSQNNRRIFGRGRFDGIASGATAIITEWPNYLSSCWLTALICGLTLFAFSIMLTSCMTYEQRPRLPRCSSDSNLHLNKTIHLVHTSHKWYQNQLELVENISSTFQHYQIHILIIGNKIPKTNTIKKEINSANTNDTHTVVNTTENILDDLVQQYPNIFITHNTYRNFFENSPLFLNWVSLNNQMKIFAVRVLQLWQFGGLSYDLLEYITHRGRRHKDFSNLSEKKVQNYVQNGYNRYEHLNPEVVSVDPQGLHMECKIPCHAFFEKVLSKLKRSTVKSTPREILTGPIYTFCKTGVIDKDFCHLRSLLFE